MWIIYLKILLALVLTVIPFWYAYYVRPKKDKPGIWRNGFTFIAAKMPAIGRVFFSIGNFFIKLHNGMRRSNSCRKFYILLFLMTVITYQYVDFHATSNALEAIKNLSSAPLADGHETSLPKAIKTTTETSAYTPFLTHPFATVLSACIGLVLFFYNPANKLLNLLHISRGIFSCTGLFIMFILLSRTAYFILAETLFLFLVAAYFYPAKIADNFPGRRKTLAEEEQKQKTLKLAA